MGERLRDLERRVAALEKRNERRKRIEAELLDAAKQYARLDRLGFYTNTEGYQVMVCQSDVPHNAARFLDKMRECAIALLMEEVG